MPKNVDIVNEILYCHKNQNLLAYHVDITYSNENTNSLNSTKENKFHQSIKIFRTQKILYLYRRISNK